MDATSKDPRLAELAEWVVMSLQHLGKHDFIPTIYNIPFHATLDTT
jgi:hypothetical protein